MTPEILTALRAAQRDKRPVVLLTQLANGRSTLLYPFESKDTSPLMEAARAALSHDAPRLIETAEGAAFLNVFNPPRRLAIVGAVHIAQPLAAMGVIAGYAVTVIDPRAAYAAPDRFPGVAVSHAWPDAALADFRPDTRTALVTLSHDPKIDDPALDAALRSPCFYIAALGSRRTHAARLERLAALGHDAAALARIRGPAGFAIGAKTPAEIALSILAEATRALRQGLESHREP